MGFTYVGTGQNGSSSSATTLAATVAGVHAGDLVLVLSKWESSDTTVSVSDGTSSLTQTSASHASVGGSEPYSTCHYLLSSVASGSVTYTVTWGAARPFRDIVVIVYTPSGSVVTDGTPPAGAGGTGTAAASGSITTTGTDGIAFGTYGEYGRPITATKINGVNSDRIVTGGFANHSAIWAKSYTSGFTGTASGTLDLSERWVLEVIAFKISGGSGVTVTPSLFTGAFSNFAPTISGGANISPSLLTSQFSNFTPIILIETTPGLITAAFSNFAPTVTGGASISPSLLTAAFGTFAPTIVTNANVSPALISAAFSAFSATVSTDTIVEPGLFTAAFSNFAPTISGAANVAPSLIAANFSNFAPTIVFDTFVTPSVFTGSFDVFAPAIQAGALIPIADLTEATFSILNPNINPAANVAKQTSARIWLALAMK